MLAEARRGKLRIIGPNCLGVMSPVSGLNATFAATMARPGSIGFISQSGALLTAVLDWTQFSRALIVAGHFTNLVGVFNLEGCLQQGFLKRLMEMNWGQTVVIPSAAVRKAILLHALLPATLWTISHLAYLVVLIMLLNV